MYCPNKVIKFYSAIGNREWQSLDKSTYDRLLFELLKGVLHPYLSPGKRVLDAGCGAGRFSVLIAEAGAVLSLLDICPDQVTRAFGSLKQRGLADRIEACIAADIIDLSVFPDNSFDTSICFGGVLNYLGQSALKGLQELIRVTREGGTIILSVLSRYGGLRFSFGNEDLDFEMLLRGAENIAASGDDVLAPESDHPYRHFFTSAELRGLLTQAGVHSFKLSSFPVLSSGLRGRVKWASKSLESWESLLKLEKIASRIPGMVDAGEQLVAEICQLARSASFRQ